MANINDTIKVKLTIYGNSILEKNISDTLGMLKNFTYQEYSPYHTDEDGYTEFTLWDFMRIFGAHFYNGCPQIIERNEIIFLPSQSHAKELYDEWSSYVRDCLEDKCFQFLSFPTWLTSVKKLSNVEAEAMMGLINPRRIKKI